jgi:hypothetical protein
LPKNGARPGQVCIQAVKTLGIIVCLHSEEKEALVFRDLVPHLMNIMQEVRAPKVKA